MTIAKLAHSPRRRSLAAAASADAEAAAAPAQATGPPDYRVLFTHPEADTGLLDPTLAPGDSQPAYFTAAGNTTKPRSYGADDH